MEKSNNKGRLSYCTEQNKENKAGNTILNGANERNTKKC